MPLFFYSFFKRHAVSCSVWQEGLVNLIPFNMRKHLLLSFLLLLTLTGAANDTSKVCQGFSGGMMVHAGMLLGQDANAPFNRHGVLCSPEGVTAGIGGAMRVNLWRLLRLGCEGFVSTMNSSLSTSRRLLVDGSYIRTGWGGLNADLCWRNSRLWPFVGFSVGGGAMHSLYLLEGSQDDWVEESRSLYHKQSFLYLNPYIGMDWCMTDKIHFSLRLDCMSALSNGSWVKPAGPRLYLGFMFCH